MELDCVSFLFFFSPFFFLIKMNRELNFCWEISPFIVDQVYLKKQLETRILHQINRRADSSCFTVLFFLKNNSGVRVSFRAARSWGQIPQPICGVPLKATVDWPQRKQSFLLLQLFILDFSLMYTQSTSIRYAALQRLLFFFPLPFSLR